MLDTIERQVVDVAGTATGCSRAGQHLKRGLLLYGPPGTGKTHTVRYLLGRTDGVTDRRAHRGRAAADRRGLLGRAHPGAVDGRRGGRRPDRRGPRHARGQHPLLFQLLNEMDGLGEDADVVFLLTTNRADLLEPALAARPGRVDQAVELGLPDATRVGAARPLPRASRAGDEPST